MSSGNQGDTNTDPLIHSQKDLNTHCPTSLGEWLPYASLSPPFYWFHRSSITGPLNVLQCKPQSPLIPGGSHSQSVTASYGPLSSGSLPPNVPGPRDGSQEQGTDTGGADLDSLFWDKLGSSCWEQTTRGLLSLSTGLLDYQRKPWSGWWRSVSVRIDVLGRVIGNLWDSIGGWVSGWNDGGDLQWVIGWGLWGEWFLRPLGRGEWWGLCKVSDERVFGVCDRESVGWMMRFWVLGASWMDGSWSLTLSFCFLYVCASVLL